MSDTITRSSSLSAGAADSGVTDSNKRRKADRNKRKK